MASAALHPPRCAVCSSTANLRICGDCRVVSYCREEHQKENKSDHKDICDTTVETRLALRNEEAKLRAAHPGIFRTGAGKFWEYPETHQYLEARSVHAQCLTHAGTKIAAEKALGHLMSMIQLDRRDKSKARELVPTLLIRLDRDQEAYDFIRWWALVPFDETYTGFTDMSAPHLDTRDANIFESLRAIEAKTNLSLHHLASLTLIKLRLRLDLEAYEVAMAYELGVGIEVATVSDLSIQPNRNMSAVIKSKIQTMTYKEVKSLAKTMDKQYNKLIRFLDNQNMHFWPTFVDRHTALRSPASMERGSKGEADIAVIWCKAAWEEIEDALSTVEEDTAVLTRAHEPQPVPPKIPPAPPGPTGDVHRVVELDKYKCAGKVIPAAYKPPANTQSPLDLYTVSPVKSDLAGLFVSPADDKKTLVYVDGVVHNGQGGWAVVYGKGTDKVLSSVLENKGPFGDANIPTSNRAELRAAVAALRMCDWKAKGFESLTIATDSAYIIDGATNWVTGWIRKGWKLRDGGDVKNKDLWELLLGDVERLDQAGVRVSFWRIKKEDNTDADSAAKKAAESTPVADFRDIIVESPPKLPTPRLAGDGVMILGLQDYDKFYAKNTDLVERINEKARTRCPSTPAEALEILNKHRPSVILVVDGDMIVNWAVWDRVIDHLHAGAKVVVTGYFSDQLDNNDFTRVFRRAGVPWERWAAPLGTPTVQLRRNATGLSPSLVARLPASYTCSSTAPFVGGVRRRAIWYGSYSRPSQGAVVVAKIGRGMLGFLGEMELKEDVAKVLLGLCGLLDEDDDSTAA